MVQTEEPQPKRKRHPNSQKPAVVTYRDAEKVAEYEAEGLALSKCLRLVNPAWTIPHWQAAIERDTILARHYETKAAELHLAMVRTIRGTTRTNLPVGTCWILERRFPADYAQPKAGGGGNSTTFNGPVQINVGSAKAARALLRKVSYPPAEPKQVKE